MNTQHQRAIEYIRNAGVSPKIAQFDEDHEPIGAQLREDMKTALLIYERVGRVCICGGWVGADKMSKHWPPSYRGRIPVKVRMACDLGPDMWKILGRGTPRIWVKKDDELPVKCNQHGAMALVTPYGELGVKPLECEIIEWRAPNAEVRDDVHG